MERHKRTEQRHYNEKARAAGGKMPDEALQRSGCAAIPLTLRAPYAAFEHAVRCVTGPGAAVLELGAGTGVHSLIAAGPDRVVVATDIAVGALKLAQQRAAAVGERLHLVCGDAENLPFRPGSFDVVTSAGALYCFQFEAVLAEMRRLLRPSGAWVIVDSFNHNPIYQLNRAIGHLRGTRTRLAVTNIPNMRTLRRLRAEFGRVRVSYHGIFTFVAPLLSRAIGDRRAAALLDACDRHCGFLRRYAFKVVVLARDPVISASSRRREGDGPLVFCGSVSPAAGTNACPSRAT
ncbi:MAG TPA: class I SAM-dependent methyltransferase [Gemmatimonadales bacterium]|nr:class I SAM-dependent methyltransferase [Gemmatimonadales bacterium]